MNGESSTGATGCNGGFMGRGEVMAGESSCPNIAGVDKLSALGDMEREGLGVRFNANKSGKSSSHHEIRLDEVLTVSIPR